MELLAVANHARLDRGWSCDAVARLGRSRRRRGSADNTGADVVPEPERRAGGSSRLRVPGRELRGGNAGLGGNDDARVSRDDFVEAIAVANHAGLRRLRCGNAVALGGRGRRRRVRLGGADEADADIVVEPKGLASRPNGRIPLHEIGESDAVLGGQDVALIARDDLVKLVAACTHARLERLRCAYAVRRLRRRWRRDGGRSWRDEGSGLGRLRSGGHFDAVRVAVFPIRTTLDRGVLHVLH